MNMAQLMVKNQSKAISYFFTFLACGRQNPRKTPHMVSANAVNHNPLVLLCGSNRLDCFCRICREAFLTVDDFTILVEHRDDV